MIKIEHLTVGYGKKILLRDICAEAGAGELIALAGRNGSGKSTLLRTIDGLMRPLSGRIVLAGRDAGSLSRRETARTVSVASTERMRIPGLKCRDLVAMGRAPWTGWSGRTGPEDENIVRKALELVGMEDLADRTMDKMSDGECQKTMIARAIAQDTPVMLLDEPTAFLDVPGKYQTASVMERLAREEGKCILFSTHDISIFLPMAGKIWLLDPPSVTVLENGPGAEDEMKRVFGVNFHAH